MVALGSGSMSVRAQLTLSGTSYTQNFDSLPTLPTGWTVRTGSTTSSLGTAGTVTTASWTDTTGNFRNVAAAESPLTSGTSTANQGTATDRALAIRPSGSFGDPNGAFLLQLQNTTGRTDFALTMKHMSCDDQPRTSVYTVEYTTVAAGTSGWTTLGTYTTTTWGATTANYDFGTALDNIGNNVWIRVRGGTSTGSGNRDTYGIDDFVLTWSTATPTITTSGTLAALSNTYGTASSSTSFTVSGADMTAGITVDPPAGFEVSQTAGGASGYAGNGNSITVGSAGTIAATTVYVRLAANATFSGSPYSGDVVCSSTGATTKNVATASSTVARKGLTITGLTGSNKTYDGNNSASFTGTAAYSGLVNSETFSISGSPTATFANATAGNGKTISVAGYAAPSANYTLTQPSLTGNIVPKALTITASPRSKTYGSTLSLGTSAFVAAGLTNSETIGSVTLTATGGTAATDAVGGYTITPSAATGGTFTAGNYSITYATGVLTVGPKALTITASNLSKCAGETLIFAGTEFGSSGLENGETIGSVTLNSSGAASGAAAGDYDITPSAATGGTFAAANYDITYALGTLTVNPAPVTSDITGSTLVQAGQTGVVYSVMATSGSTYAWTVPAGASITAGGTGPDNNEITVSFGTNSGNVAVVETSAIGCSGSLVTLPVSVNNNPVAPNLSLGLPVGQTASLLIIGGKNAPIDADGNTLIVTSVTQGEHGTVSFTSTNLTYASTSAASSDSFTYTVSDGNGGTATGTVTVTLSSGGSFNQLAAKPIEGGALVFTYLGIPGIKYALEVTHDLTPPATWSGLQTNAANNIGSIIFTNTPSLAPTNDYYRTSHVQ